MVFLRPSPSYLGVHQESLHQEKRCSYRSYHSGNFKGFKSSMPGTGDKDQISFLLYHSNIIPILQIVTRCLRRKPDLAPILHVTLYLCSDLALSPREFCSHSQYTPHLWCLGTRRAYPDWPKPLRIHRSLSWSPSPWAGPMCIFLGLKAGQQRSCLMEHGHVGCPYDCVWGPCMQDVTGVRREQGQGTSIFILAQTLQIFSNPNQILVSV